MSRQRWFGGIGFGAERLGIAALNFPRTAWAFLILFVVLIGCSLPHISFDDDIHRVFLSDSPLSQAQRRFEAQQSPPTSTVLIRVASQTAFDADDMTSLRDLALDLEFIEGVTAVASPFILRWPPSDDAPSGTPVFGQKIEPAFRDDITKFTDLNTGLPVFVNAPLTAMLLSVSVDTTTTTVASATSMVRSELDRALPSKMTANITGEDVISAEIVSGLKDDLIALNVWGALIVVIAAIVLLRDVRMAFLAVVPALIGATGVLSLGVWLGYPLTVVSNVIPILLLVLGVADGIHLAGHLKHHGDIRATIETVGPACALTALTTAVAFASIMITGNAQLFEFAVLGAIGTLLSFAIIIVTFALLGRRIRLSDKPVPQFSAHMAQRLAAIGAGRPRIVIMLCTFVLISATFGFSQTKAWFPLYQNLPDASPTVAINDAISAEFGGVFQMVVETQSDWETTRALVEKLEDASGPQSVFSELNFARWLGHPDVRPTPQELETLPQALVNQLRNTQNTSRIFVSVAEPMRTDETLVQFDALYNIADAAGEISIIGLPTIMRLEAVNLIEQLSWSLVAAALGATGLVALAFRSFRLLPILIIPNILPLMVTGASLHLSAQGQLSPTAVLALTIAFGIAIDDTVHFLNRFYAATTQGQLPKQAVISAARSAGQMMVLTTLLLSVGLAVTLFSDFTPIRLFGGMMIVTLWVALLVDLLLLPALLIWKRTLDVSRKV